MPNAIKRPAIRVIGPSIAYIPLTQGYFSLIDADDVDITDVCSWHAADQRKNYSGVRCCSSSRGFISRFLLGNPDGLVDHINRNPLDNRRSNLRVVNDRENSENRGRSLPNGVRFIAGKFEAYIHVGISNRYLGRYRTKEEAAEARRSALKCLLEGKELPQGRRRYKRRKGKEFVGAKLDHDYRSAEHNRKIGEARRAYYA